MPLGAVTAGTTSSLFEILLPVPHIAMLRNFVPKYTSLAQKITLKTKELNQNNDSPYPVTKFVALDCVKFSNVCQKQGVEFYPTIQVYNFVNTNSKMKKNMEGVERDLLSFFAKTIFTVSIVVLEIEMFYTNQ